MCMGTQRLPLSRSLEVLEPFQICLVKASFCTSTVSDSRTRKAPLGFGLLGKALADV